MLPETPEPALYPECTNVDLDDPAQVQEVYDLYLAQYTQAERDAFKAQAEAEMFDRMDDIYNTNNWSLVVAQWILNPLGIINLDPNYGFSHAAELYFKLLIDRDAAEEEIRRYFVREAQARCTGTSLYPPTEEWLNPTAWVGADGVAGSNEDSRLDYFTPLFLAEWYL